MKKKDLQDLKTKSIEFLKKEIQNKMKSKNEFKIERDTNKAKNVHKIRALRREIAQITTLINEKAFTERMTKESKEKETHAAS